ncbi:histidinol-phosphate transaminase [Caulobacter sp. SL161]|uniref:histidinol-phosphate transaminase n=1 Tax=Caulobacter sp. SL161 TaxID=2995156 RepID=UPI0022760AC9|nr:histidinol-phosphate transaminase [Caulobacter sp. SL161]MCY1648533.1 histidinol-phosphate transaminase [Caulobacter sp. SL161]
MERGRMLVLDRKPLTPAWASPMRQALEGVQGYKAGMTLAEAGRRTGLTAFSKLASNENLLGPSPKVAEAVMAAMAEPHIYPDPHSDVLRAAIGERLGVSPARLVISPGSEALIDYVFRAVLHPGDSILLSSPTFPTYEIFGRCAEARIIDVPRLANFDMDVPAVCAAAAQGPKLLVLCTPNNPTGNALKAADFQAILAATPRSTVVFVDEAYREYHEAFDTFALLDAWGGPWVSARTFSKAYGLAGLRMGYGVASSPELVDYLDRIRPPFNVTAVSQAAALAAWEDQDYLKRTVAQTIAERGRVEAVLDDMGVEHTESRANFVFLRTPAGPDATAAHLLHQGLIIRPTPVAGGWVRITIGRPADNDALIAALPAALSL